MELMRRNGRRLRGWGGGRQKAGCLRLENVVAEL